MKYKVVITLDAEEDLDRFIRYLLFAKRNPQAATNVLNDFDETQQSLASIAGNLRTMRQSTSACSWIQKDSFSEAPVFYAVQDRGQSCHRG